MFSLMNRIRGMYSWFWPVYALCIATVVYLIVGNLYVTNGLAWDVVLITLGVSLWIK